MAVTAAAGYPQHHGVLIPELWIGKFLDKFYKTTVFGSICNRDYEGQIRKAGDLIKVRTVPDITIRDGTKGGEVTYENPVPTVVEMAISRYKYWAVAIDDVDRAQSDLNFAEAWTADGAQQLAISVDATVLQGIYADPSSTNEGATAGEDADIDLGAAGAPVQMSRANILDYIVYANEVLDGTNCPSEDRWMLLPPKFISMLKLSDLKDASMTGDGVSVLRNGRLGKIDDVTVYKTRNLKSVTDGTTSQKSYYCMFGHKSAVSFAAQITKTEKGRFEKYFGDYVRSMMVYDFKTFIGDNLGCIYAAKAA